MPARHRRQKISTTIAPENGAFLKSLIRRGKAANLAEAVDSALRTARRAENRARLEAATEAYFASLSPEEREEESRLSDTLDYEAGLVNFDE
jgi:Arc/MetJ-type ribon-helix-helix transcriptional regulator